MWKKYKGVYENFCIDPDDGPGAIEYQFELCKSMGWCEPRKKSNSLSSGSRCMGNTYYKKENWFIAMKLYNISLANAEIGSENISLAYANRSACFLQMKMFDKALVDIELAIEAGYPQKSMSKLLLRKDECLKMIEKGALFTRPEPKLDYKEDDDFPGMANVLQIGYDGQYGRMITAKSDIPAGKMVLIEKQLMMISMQDKFLLCSTCHKSYTNLVSCQKCPEVLFCKGQCEKNRFHGVECGARCVSFEHEATNDQYLDVFRSILIAIDLFPNVKALKQFVEETVCMQNSVKIPQTLADGRSKYRAFLQLWYSEMVSEDKFPRHVYFTSKLMLSKPEMKNKFSTPKDQRFLQHLIAQHTAVIQCNSGGIIWQDKYQKFSRELSGVSTIIATYLNHSCAPNVNVISFDDNNICYTIRSIKKGEQLFVSYFRNDPRRHSYTTDFRQKNLRLYCHFDCKCERCSAHLAPESESKIMKADPLFVAISKHKEDANKADGDEAKVLMDKCIEFLNKYGHLKWSEEIGKVGDKYNELMIHKHQATMKYYTNE